MMCLGLANGVKEPTKVWKERMTPQEALKLLNNVEFKHEYQGEDQYGDMSMWCKDALEKQIPMKPIEKVEKDYWGNIIDSVYICSECNRFICHGVEIHPEENYPYCHCGQAVDWGDTK